MICSNGIAPQVNVSSPLHRQSHHVPPTRPCQCRPVCMLHWGRSAQPKNPLQQLLQPVWSERSLAGHVKFGQTHHHPWPPMTPQGLPVCPSAHPISPTNCHITSTACRICDNDHNNWHFACMHRMVGQAHLSRAHDRGIKVAVCDESEFDKTI